MRKRLHTVLLFSFTCVGIAEAQNPHASASVAVTERLATSERDRAQWEAGQMWSASVMPFREEVREHSIHIDVAQPLTLPKLRREWLLPSSEAASEKTA